MASTTNLNPGADATLVAAATNAAMANVPQDYSKAFGEIAKGYGKYAAGLGNIYKGLVNANSEAIGKLTDGIKEYVGDTIDLWSQKEMVKNDEYEIGEYSSGDKSILEWGVQDARDHYVDGAPKEDWINYLISIGYDENLTDIQAAAIGIDDVTSFMDKKKEAIKATTTSGTEFKYTNSNNIEVEVVVADDKAFFLTLKDQMTTAQGLENKNDRKDEILRINNLKKSAKNSDRKFARVLIDGLQAIENEELLIQPLNGGVTIDFLRAADARGERIDDGSHIKEGFDKNGNKVIIWVDKFGKVKVNPITGKQFVATAGDISDFLVKKDATVQAGIDKAITIDQIERSSIEGAKFEENKTKKAIMAQVSNKHKFLNAINESHGNMKQSYVEAVYGGSLLTEEMYVELNKLGGRFDNDKSGKVGEEDFATKENLAVLAKFLTTDSPTSREIFTNFVLGEAEIKFDEGVERRALLKREAVGFQEGNQIKAAKGIEAANLEGYNVNNVQAQLPRGYTAVKVNDKGESADNGKLLAITKGNNIEFIVDPSSQDSNDYLTAWLYSQNGIK
tara:strand:- start:2529 stop:4217 length:1689 start_codon:yes stop_codon:yes gene_type:complete